jgi:hypothetical protein
MAALRANINAETRVPQTVPELVAHYLRHELSRKACASQ